MLQHYLCSISCKLLCGLLPQGISAADGAELGILIVGWSDCVVLIRHAARLELLGGCELRGGQAAALPGGLRCAGTGGS